MKKIFILIFGGILLVVGCDAFERESVFIKYRESKTLMGTVVHIDVCLPDEDTDNVSLVYNEIWNRMEDIHWRMSVFDQRSDVSKVNQSYSSPVSIGEDTFEVILKALDFSQLTSGTFDITVWPIIALWRDAAAANTLPRSEDVVAVKESIGWDLIRLHPGHRVELLDPRTQIDLGGIAKGYAIDEGVRIFREHGIKQFYIDAGGDIYAGGLNCHNEPWRIGIRDPRNTSRIIDLIKIQDQAITTSGDYERYFEIQGQRWSHIINPITAYPQKGVISATVIAPTALEADALSTALTVLRPDRGHSLIDDLGENYMSMTIIPSGRSGLMKQKSKRWKP